MEVKINGKLFPIVSEITKKTEIKDNIIETSTNEFTIVGRQEVVADLWQDISSQQELTCVIQPINQTIGGYVTGGNINTGEVNIIAKVLDTTLWDDEIIPFPCVKKKVLVIKPTGFYIVRDFISFLDFCTYYNIDATLLNGEDIFVNVNGSGEDQTQRVRINTLSYTSMVVGAYIVATNDFYAGVVTPYPNPYALQDLANRYIISVAFEKIILTTNADGEFLLELVQNGYTFFSNIFGAGTQSVEIDALMMEGFVRELNAIITPLEDKMNCTLDVEFHSRKTTGRKYPFGTMGDYFKNVIKERGLYLYNRKIYTSAKSGAIHNFYPLIDNNIEDVSVSSDYITYDRFFKRQDYVLLDITYSETNGNPEDLLVESPFFAVAGNGATTPLGSNYFIYRLNDSDSDKVDAFPLSTSPLLAYPLGIREIEVEGIIENNAEINIATDRVAIDGKIFNVKDIEIDLRTNISKITLIK